MLSEHLSRVAHLSIGARNIDHSQVHAHIAYHRTALASDQHLATIVTQAAVEPVSITYRDDCYLTVLGQESVSAITYALTFLHRLNAQKGRSQCAHRQQLVLILKSRETIHTYTQSAHIILIITEPLYTSRVEYMLDDRIAELLSQSVGTLIEALYLSHGESVPRLFIGGSKMREDRSHTQCLLRTELLDKTLHILIFEA